MKKPAKKAKKNGKKKVIARLPSNLGGLRRISPNDSFTYEGEKYKTTPGFSRLPMPEDAAVAASRERTTNAWKESGAEHKLSAQLITELTDLASKHFKSDLEKSLNAEVWNLRMELSKTRREKDVFEGTLIAIASDLGFTALDPVSFSQDSQKLRNRIKEILNPVVIISGGDNIFLKEEFPRIIQTAEDAKRDMGSVDIWAPIDVPEVRDDVGGLADPWFSQPTKDSED